MQLEDSLSFDDEQGKSERATWFTDVYRADRDAFRIGPQTEDVITFDAPGQARAYTFEVAEGAPLDVTLAYTSPPTSLAVGTPALVNDLNLVLLSPDGLVYSGNNYSTRAVPSADSTRRCPASTPTHATRSRRCASPSPPPGRGPS